MNEEGNFVPWMLPDGAPPPIPGTPKLLDYGHVRIQHYGAPDGDPNVMVVNPHPSHRNFQRLEAQRLREAEAIPETGKTQESVLVDIAAEKAKLIARIKIAPIPDDVKLDHVQALDAEAAKAYAEELKAMDRRDLMFDLQDKINMNPKRRRSNKSRTDV